MRRWRPPAERRKDSAIGALVAREATGLRSLAMTAAATGSHKLMG
jgi:hypothetical protein